MVEHSPHFFYLEISLLSPKFVADKYLHARQWSVFCVLAFCVLALPVTSLHAGEPGSCMDRYNIVDNNYYASLNCTANESAISGVELVVSTNEVGCLQQGDNTKYQVLIDLNGSNTNRYDMGLYLNTAGGSARTDATDNACFQEILLPNFGTVDLLSGLGPYPEYDGTSSDSCGDIDTAALKRWLMDGTSHTQKADVDFFCDDSNNNGLMDLNGCVAYANVSGQNICTDFTSPGNEGAGTPGTKSKCSCGEGDATNPPVPMADIGSSCSCTFNQSTRDYDCAAIFSNTAPASLFATIDTAPNSLQPGTASFLRYKINDLKTSSDTDAGGTFTLGTATNGTASLGTGGAEVLIIPEGGRCTGGVTCTSSAPEQYVLGPGEITTLPFTYSNTIADEVVILKIDTYKAADNTFSYEEAQVSESNVQCQVYASATYASIGDVSSTVEDDMVTLHWETSAEAGSFGFDVYRMDARQNGSWIKVNNKLVPSAQNVSGGRYSLQDPGASPGRSHVYKVVEQDWRGTRTELGPFPTSPRQVGKRSIAAEFKQESTTINEPTLGQARVSIPVSSPYTSIARGKDDAFTARIEAANDEKSNIEKKDRKRKQISADALKIVINQDGFYSINIDEIAAAFSLKEKDASKLIGKTRLNLTSQGEQVAWEPGEDNLSLRFYGQANTSRYSRDNHYWLTEDNGLEISTVEAATGVPANPDQGFSETVVVEKDLLSSPFFVPAPNDDFQFWARVRSDTPGGTTFNVASPGAIDLGGNATLSAEVVRSVGTGSATITVNVGDECSDSVEWLGATEVSISVPQSCLLPVNDVVIESLDGNFVVDSLRLAYTRQYTTDSDSLEFRGDGNSVVTVTGFTDPAITVYKLGNPNAPERLENLGIESFGVGYGVTLSPGMSEENHIALASVMTPYSVEPYIYSTLRDTRNHGNYLVIGRDNFSETATSLITLRSKGDTQPMFVDLAHIMNEFNHGNFDPSAIRDFLRYASENWDLGPQSVALVGKGHFDYMDDQGMGNNPMPPMIERTSTAYVPADNLLGDLNGDSIPEIAIGRIPVLTPTEFAAYIEKLTEHEWGNPGAWNTQVHMVADKVDYKAGDFPFNSLEIASLLPAELDITETFLFQPWTLEESRNRLMSSFNEGSLLVNLIGHGNPVGFSGYPHSLLTSDDAKSMMLSGPGQPPMVVALSCLINTHAIPGIQSLGEDLVMNSDGGAIAVLGPLGLSVNQQSVSMGQHLLPAMLEAGSSSIGAAYVSALHDYVAAGGDIESIQLYSLLGDPMINLGNQ